MFRACTRRHAAIGFVGLGQMGARMVPNLFKDPNNTEVHLFDVNIDNVKAVEKLLKESGKNAKICASPAEVAKGCKIIITMLPNTKIVKAVYFENKDSLFGAAQEGTVFIDSSTIDPATPQKLAAEAQKKKGMFFDAPVSGGINGAAAGTLTFMVGSGYPAKNEEEFEIAKKILIPMSKNTILCGAVGSGQVVKICNNLILGQAMVAVSEAMLLGTRLGVDPKTLAGVINTSTGNCWSSNAYNPYPGVMENVPSSRGYAGGFGSALMLKDLGLAMEAAQSAGLSVSGGRNAHDVYSSMCGANMGQLDFSGVLKYLDVSSPKK